MKFNNTCYSSIFVIEMKRLDLWPLNVNLTLSMGTNVLCMAYPPTLLYFSMKFNEVCFGIFLSSCRDVF